MPGADEMKAWQRVQFGYFGPDNCIRGTGMNFLCRRVFSVHRAALLRPALAPRG
jgi:hypothetical protein